MMTKLCLVRHGQTDWNLMKKMQGQTNIPLNQTGKQQARECRDYLAEMDFDLIVSSPLSRAKETATIINEKLMLPIVEMNEFMERHFGVAEGMEFEERESRFPNRQYPNEEPGEEFKERLVNGLSEIHNKYPNQSVLVVAHGAVIHMIFSMLDTNHDRESKIGLHNGCINHLHFIQGIWKIKGYNLVNHLSEHNQKV